MRKLLELWGKLEPEKCEKSIGNTFIIQAAEVRHYCESDDLGARNLAWIQWAVQAAIVERGWSFMVGHDSHYGFGYEAEINDSTAEDKRAQGHSSVAEVLLTAYLIALEEAR